MGRIFLLVGTSNFFEYYKKLEKEEVKVEEFQNAEIAKQILTQAIADYNKEWL